MIFAPGLWAQGPIASPNASCPGNLGGSDEAPAGLVAPIHWVTYGTHRLDEKGGARSNLGTAKLNDPKIISPESVDLQRKLDRGDHYQLDEEPVNVDLQAFGLKVHAMVMDKWGSRYPSLQEVMTFQVILPKSIGLPIYLLKDRKETLVATRNPFPFRAISQELDPLFQFVIDRSEPQLPMQNGVWLRQLTFRVATTGHGTEAFHQDDRVAFTGTLAWPTSTLLETTLDRVIQPLPLQMAWFSGGDRGCLAGEENHLGGTVHAADGVGSEGLRVSVLPQWVCPDYRPRRREVFGF